MCRENNSIRTQILSYVRRGTLPGAWGAVYVCRGGVLNLMALNIEEEAIGYICVSLSTTGNECTL